MNVETVPVFAVPEVLTERSTDDPAHEWGGRRPLA
jgi:hypothetical protein